MPGILGELFIELDLWSMLQIIFLGFVGGILSGFIGSGGAFFMTPGMMNLGIPGVVAVGTNITHKFGKAMVGAKKHGEMGHVDKKLAIFMLISAAIGIRIAVWIYSLLFETGAGNNAEKGAAANLYLSLIFVCFLSVVAISMIRDIIKTSKEDITGPSKKITEFLNKLRLPPMIYFPVADVSVSLWIVLICGLATGYLAGTIGVGGFIGVPAMIYVFGIPTAVAAGTELFLAMFMGAWGLMNYVYAGYVDVRLVLLLYLGSLVGIYIGAYGTKVVKEVSIRLVTSCIILLCVVSRGIAIPMYLRQLGLIDMDSEWDFYWNQASKIILFLSGISGAVLILGYVIKAYIQRKKVRTSLEAHRVTP